jgi:hypothetical protein
MNVATLAIILTLAAPLAAAQTPAAPVWDGARAAFFGVSFIDDSHEGELNGERADETARVDLVESQIAAALEEKGVELLDLAPVADVLARVRSPADCNGCDLAMAETLGADLVILSEVSKTSNLILAINIVVLDAETGERLRGLSVDIRGNNDESWSRGVGYILRNAIFKE